MKTDILKLLKGSKKTIKVISTVCREKSPTILTALAVGGLVATVAATVKGTLKAKEALDALEKKAEEEEKEVETIDKVKAVAKYYVPATIFGGLTVASVIGANAISTKRLAALAGLYSLSEASIKEYQAALSDDKRKEVREKVADQCIRKTPIEKDKIEYTGQGMDLCFDIWSGRYFYSNASAIKVAVAEFNNKLLYENALPLNDLYMDMGLETCELGYMVGWKVGDIVRPIFDSRLASDGTPVLSISFKAEPSVSFQTW